MLGKIFKTDRIIGPFSITHMNLKTVDLYAIGEVHERNGNLIGNDVATCAPDHHVVEHIRKFCETKSHKVHILVETSAIEAQSIGVQMMHVPYSPRFLLHAQNPITALSYSIYNGCFKENVSITLSDVRKTKPYDLFMLIMFPNLFAINRYGFQHITAHITQVRKWAKMSEKIFIKQLNSKLNVRTLLESFYLPGSLFPIWLQNLYKTIYGDDDMANPLQVKMQDLKKRDSDMYSHVLKYMDMRWSSLQNSRDSFYSAMVDVENARRSSSERLVVEKDEDVLQIFIALSSFLYDLDIILDILKLMAFEKNITIITMTGAQHSGHIARFFEPLASVPVSKASQECDLKEGNGVSSIIYANDIPIDKIIAAIRQKHKNPDVIKL